MQQSVFILTAASAVALAGCTTVPEQAGPEEPAPDQATGNCPVIESEGWTATISPLAGNPDRGQLTVSGRVTMPTPGYSFGWEAGRLDRSAVPSFELRMIANPPGGMVTQVLDTREVTYAGPAAAPRYSAITIVCEGRVLARIEDVS